MLDNTIVLYLCEVMQASLIQQKKFVLNISRVKELMDLRKLCIENEADCKKCT